MLLNYLKHSLRLMMRNPFLTLINVAGLSVGFAAFYVLWPYTVNELRSDQFHQDYERIARLSRTYTFEENGIHHSLDLPMHNAGIAKQFAREYPEIVGLTRIVTQQLFESFRQGFDKDVFVSIEMNNGERQFFREHNLVYADSNFFQFFSFPLEKGQRESVLSLPKTAVVSASHARKYFGDNDPINKIMYFNDSVPIKITGVFKDLPKNTHMKADVILSTAGIKEVNLTGWSENWWGHCYIKVKKGTDLKVLQDKINSKKERIYGVCPRCPENSFTSVLIQPLKTVVFTNLIGNTFNYKSRYLLITLNILAFFIPALAWINFISLSVHLLQKRISELSVRKVVGAGGRHFALQFIAEALLYNTISFFIALTIVQTVRIALETWLNFYTVPWSELTQSVKWIVVIMFLFGIIMTSAYPILLCLNQRSLFVVKKTWSYRRASWVNFIITSQYAAAIALLITVVCIYLQLDFVISKPLGVEKDGIVVIDCPLQQNKDFDANLNYFITSASAIAGVHGATVSKNVIGDFAGYGVPIQKNKNGIEFGFDINGGVDANFMRVYGIKLLYGRNFNASMPSDQRAILVSRDATARLGFTSPEQALGARVILPWHNHDDVEIIGVYEDYEFRPRLLSYFQPHRGSFMSYRDYLMPDLYPSKISVRIDFQALETSIPALEKLFKEVFPQDTFHSVFLDDNVQKYYSSEKIARNQIGAFTLIAIFIACLGLLGLVSNKIVQKTKEIGIRKVLGAGLLQITQILLNTTTRQLALAALISIPLAYLVVSQYLEKFTDRIVLQWWHFVYPLLFLVIVMFSTIAAVVWKAARGNPVEALKYE